MTGFSAEEALEHAARADGDAEDEEEGTAPLSMFRLPTECRVLEVRRESPDFMLAVYLSFSGGPRTVPGICSPIWCSQLNPALQHVRHSLISDGGPRSKRTTNALHPRHFFVSCQGNTDSQMEATCAASTTTP